MQISHYNTFLYIFVGIIASACIYLSRTLGDKEPNIFTGRTNWVLIISALSLFAGSIFQFWILLLPLFSLSLPGFLIILSLIISVILPILFVKNRDAIVNRFMELFSLKLRTILFIVIVIFLAMIQPFALLYLGEKIIAQFLGGSYHFLLVFLIGVAGLITLIGGEKVDVYANTMFGIAIIASMLEIIYLGRSFSAPLIFLQMLLTESTQYFQNHNVIETNWIIGFIGFSVITWWMWWIDNGAFHRQGKHSEQRNSKVVLFASFSLILIALVVFPTKSYGETTPLDVPVVTSVIVNNELLAFFFVLTVVSVMVSAFSHSFQTIATIVVEQFFHLQAHQSNDEKHILIARLVIVLSALLTILYIPFAQIFGALTLLVYIQFLACLAASIVGTFTVFLFWKNIYSNGITTGIIGGMSSGIILIVLTNSSTEIIPPMLTTPYGAATGVFFFSIICSIAGSVVVERKAAKRSIIV